jgi:hypothetical protein
MLGEGRACALRVQRIVELVFQAVAHTVQVGRDDPDPAARVHRQLRLRPARDRLALGKHVFIGRQRRRAVICPGAGAMQQLGIERVPQALL